MSQDKMIKLTFKNTVEQNKKALRHAMNNTPHMKGLRESVRSQCGGLDILDSKKFPAHDSGFSLAAVRKKLMEANVASGFPQLLRAGVQVAFNNLIENYDGTIYNEVAHVIPSTMDTELYAPLHGISFLGERGPLQKFPEAQIAGLDLRLTNRFFGEMLTIAENLWNDDQTGQLAQTVGDLAEWTELAKEVYCMGKINSVQGQNYAGLVIPPSETKPSYEANYPWTTSAAPFVGGGFNKPTGFGGLSQPNIQTAIEAQMVQKNLLGLIMNVKSQKLLVGPVRQFDAMILMNSTNNPSTVATLNGSAAGAFSVNPIKSILDVIVGRYLFDNVGNCNGTSKAWYIYDGSKPWMVMQLRDPGSVVQENPQSGESFERQAIRHRLDLRFNTDFIDPRFIWQGSDGSA